MALLTGTQVQPGAQSRASLSKLRGRYSPAQQRTPRDDFMGVFGQLIQHPGAKVDAEGMKAIINAAREVSGYDPSAENSPASINAAARAETVARGVPQLSPYLQQREALSANMQEYFDRGKPMVERREALDAQRSAYAQAQAVAVQKAREAGTYQGGRMVDYRGGGQGITMTGDQFRRGLEIAAGNIPPGAQAAQPSVPAPQAGAPPAAPSRFVGVPPQVQGAYARRAIGSQAAYPAQWQEPAVGPGGVMTAPSAAQAQIAAPLAVQGPVAPAAAIPASAAQPMPAAQTPQMTETEKAAAWNSFPIRQKAAKAIALDKQMKRIDAQWKGSKNKAERAALLNKYNALSDQRDQLQAEVEPYMPNASGLGKEQQTIRQQFAEDRLNPNSAWNKQGQEFRAAGMAGLQSEQARQQAAQAAQQPGVQGILTEPTDAQQRQALAEQKFALQWMAEGQKLPPAQQEMFRRDYAVLTGPIQAYPGATGPSAEDKQAALKRMRTYMPAEVVDQLEQAMGMGANPLPGEANVQPIRDDNDYDMLPSGAEFVGPDGVKRRKP